MPRFQVVVTRDTSESVFVTVEAPSADEADAVAIEYVNDNPDPIEWEADDYASKPYASDPGNACEVCVCGHVDGQHDADKCLECETLDDAHLHEFTLDGAS